MHQWESFACHPKHARMELRCWMFVQETEWKQHEQIMVCIGFDGFDPSLYETIKKKQMIGWMFTYKVLETCLLEPYTV